MDERFLDSLDAWDNLDGMLRALYSFSGCVMGAGLRCPHESPELPGLRSIRRWPGQLGRR